VHHQLTALYHQPIAQDAIALRARRDDALPALDCRQGRRQPLASTPTHPLLAAQADNILVYTHPALHFAPKRLTLFSTPLPLIYPPFVYIGGSKKIYILF
jgi:hypothetical protein